MPFPVKILIFIHILLGLGAIYGGGLLILAPNGRLMGMPLSMLDHSPFHNFLVPGFILFVTFGLMPLGVAYALFTKRSFPHTERLNIFNDRHWAWTYSLYTGFALIIWITVQVCFLKDTALLHFIYMAWGLLIQMLSLWPTVQEFYKE